MGYEIVYKGRDNTNDFILKADGVAVDLSGVTKMELVFNSDFVVDSESTSGVFDWSQGDGKLILAMGSIDELTIGTKPEPNLIVYDASNTDGINWGIIPLNIL